MNIESITNKIEDGYIKSIDCGQGWRPLLETLDQMITFIDPHYKILQVKEKFGTLRYYYVSSFEFDSIQNQIIQALVDNAEQKSSRTCENCGSTQSVNLCKIRGWLITLCGDCEEKRNKK